MQQLNPQLPPTLLHAAAQGGNLAIFELVFKGAKESDFDSVAEDGTTPLFLAAQGGYENIAKLLITKSKHTNQKLVDGYSAILYFDTDFHDVAREGNLQRFMELSKKCADVNPKNEKGETPTRRR